jgi:hypothetical protein
MVIGLNPTGVRMFLLLAIVNVVVVVVAAAAAAAFEGGNLLLRYRFYTKFVRYNLKVLYHRCV